MKYALFLLPVLLWQNNNTEPAIQNVQFKQSGQQVIITYDIANAQDWQTFDIEIFYSGNGGYSYGKALQAVEGDVGYGIKGGDNKRIIWRVLEERPNGVVGNRIKFKVEATIKGKAPMPDNMVYVEGGTFQMGDLFDEGSSHEKPVHTVTLSSFYISKYEVTNAEYADFLNAKSNQTEGGRAWLNIEGSFHKIQKSGSRYTAKSGYESHPVIEVSWYGAKAYCDWRTQVTGKQHRLPTEAEWEYAARERGKKVRFGNGKNIADPSEINFYSKENGKESYSVVGSYRGKTVPVNSFSPNSLGLYNMSGNVWEWCSDWYAGDYYSKSPRNNPMGASSGSYRVVRGGSWHSYPSYCRAAFRNFNTHGYQYLNVGFRIVVP